MKDIGSPGTWSGLALRVLQCVTAMASFATTAAAYAFATNSYGVFRYLMYTMFGQFLWSFLLGCVDVVAIKKQHNLRVRRILLPLGLIDWAMAVLTFAASSSSAGVAFFFGRDTNMCELYAAQLCSHYNTSVVLALVTWCFSAASAAAVFWVLASD